MKLFLSHICFDGWSRQLFCFGIEDKCKWEALGCREEKLALFGVVINDFLRWMKHQKGDLKKGEEDNMQWRRRNGLWSFSSSFLYLPKWIWPTYVFASFSTYWWLTTATQDLWCSRGRDPPRTLRKDLKGTTPTDCLLPATYLGKNEHRRRCIVLRR